MVQQGGVETWNNFNRQSTIFGGAHANYSAVWELKVSGAFMHQEVSVIPGNLFEIKCLRIQWCECLTK